MARLYADENFPLPTVEGLRHRGHDVLTVQETGQGGLSLSDGAVLEWAGSQGRAMLTVNRRHFVRLHRERPEHSGIIVCSFDLDYDGQAARIHAAIEGGGELAGQLMRVNRPAAAREKK
ncbi:MAG: DUF5615 family PIN-like protein [Planctomycetota bacterium]